MKSKKLKDNKDNIIEDLNEIEDTKVVNNSTDIPTILSLISLKDIERLLQ